MQTIFIFSYNLAIKQKPELRLNSMVWPAIMDFRVFYFFTYKVWQSMAIHFKKSVISSNKFKTWKIKTTSHKWDIHFFQKFPPLWSILDHVADKLLMHKEVFEWKPI